MSKQPNASSISTLAIIAGITGLVFNIRDYDLYYLDEPLTSKSIIINDKPEYVNGGGKGSTSRYTFGGNNYQCQFWLSEGALDAARRNDSVENAIKAINIGDTIEIKIRTTDDSVLQDDSKKVRVMGLMKQNRVLIDPQYVSLQDRDSRNINLGAAAIAFLAGIICKIRNRHNTQDTYTDEYGVQQ